MTSPTHVYSCESFSPGLPEWAKLQVWMNPKNDVHILWLFVYFWVLPFQSIIYIYKTVQSALFSSCHMSSVTTSGRRATQPPRSSTRCRSLSATTSPWRRSVRSSRRRTVRSVNWNTVRRRKSCNVRLQVEMHLQTIRSRVTVVRGQKVRASQPSLASCLRHRRREATQQSAFFTASSVMWVWCVWARDAHFF